VPAPATGVAAAAGGGGAAAAEHDDVEAAADLDSTDLHDRSHEEEEDLGGNGAASGSDMPAIPYQAGQRHGNYHGAPPELTEVEQSRLLATLAGASVLVGMHPDQATEYIVSCALALRKPWAVVPCCVFAREFPQRRLYTKPPATTAAAAAAAAAGAPHSAARTAAGAAAPVLIDKTAAAAAAADGEVDTSAPVVEFSDFVEYLKRKPAVECGQPRAQQIYLPWQGKNCVVFQPVVII
jgi:hypothetical protein